MSKNIKDLQIDEYNRLSVLLEGIHSFIERHQSITYIEFDYYVVHDMILFSVEPDFDFDKLKQAIELIKKSTPAVKRIFKKPIIILKDEEDVLPVENARVINQNTLLHLANHAQYISNITKKGVKPRKLLTRIYEDEYGIYENIIFCNYIDEILSLIRVNRKVLNSIFYASNIMRFNLLEKGNHINYFLALGKLHTGYIRDFNKYYNLSKDLLGELHNLNKTIKARLHKPVYRRNNKRNKRLRLKKTNIFLNQKDYKMVYKTYKNLLSRKTVIKEKNEIVDIDMIRRGYLRYVRILTVFAVGHFNFTTNTKLKMDLNFLEIDFRYKNWHLNIINNDLDEMILEFKKDKIYKMLITSIDYPQEELEKIKVRDFIDEVVKINHFDDDYLNSKEIFISVEDVDSFRRIQQIILKGMIYSDTKRRTCPFCGGKLIKDKYREIYQCDNCLIQIREAICENTGISYTFTYNEILNKQNFDDVDIGDDDDYFYKKQIESAMYYRNITKIDENGRIICPHCNNIHKVS